LTTTDPLAERRAARAAAGPDDAPGTPVMPDVVQNRATPGDPAIGRVVATRVCTASKKAAGIVRHVEIDVSGTPLAGTFRSGQSFGVLPPGENERGKPHKLRLYSIASPTRGEDGSGSVLATTVKRLIDEDWESHRLFTGVASNYLCDLSEGDEVRVTGPAGKRFVLPEDPSSHDYVFFATGTGIAPFRGMLGDLAASGVSSRAALVMGAPYATDLLYDAEMRELEAEHDWFTYLPTVSRHGPTPGAGGGWGPSYVDGRVSPDAPGGEQLIELLAGERTLVYVCGIAGMELGVFQAMARELASEALSGYLTVADDAGEPSDWTRRMIPRQLRPTKRTFLEVY